MNIHLNRITRTLTSEQYNVYGSGYIGTLDVHIASDIISCTLILKDIINDKYDIKDIVNYLFHFLEDLKDENLENGTGKEIFIAAYKGEGIGTFSDQTDIIGPI